jgi:hypothetical protein
VRAWCVCADSDAITRLLVAWHPEVAATNNLATDLPSNAGIALCLCLVPGQPLRSLGGTVIWGSCRLPLLHARPPWKPHARCWCWSSAPRWGDAHPPPPPRPNSLLDRPAPAPPQPAGWGGVFVCVCGGGHQAPNTARVPPQPLPPSSSAGGGGLVQPGQQPSHTRRDVRVDNPSTHCLSIPQIRHLPCIFHSLESFSL